ncbi:XshC-Cox1 family protein [Gordonia sp. 852002-50816_SCH5313054-c]|uniref:XdhC family protein n=1 Tax=unclassified Gordonia (in: high G+C Gram-positive bacteria) TaxID=2657482 RepID=UPI0007EA2E8A|nr:MULTISPECIES: XdhC/CoxI family protein [unclassified Gordonia (in: high G+C Gram-positive bacteria)]OBC06843.1 XshC-Cox1 family protein [Gordonia sp. 852002-50816_SCH5313054-a]OBC13666.1 XshC-Cox1 family protein [Gordonia sp. 852002-50816_SCH5313054-c]
MRDVLPVVIDRLGRGPVAIARIIGTSGPTPRGVGAAMAVTADGEVIGSVSGGCVESALVHTCMTVLDDGCAVVEHFGIADPDGIEVGLTCGGSLEVFVERVDSGHRRALDDLAGHLAADRRVAWATTLSDSPEWHITTSTSEPWRRLGRDVADLLASGRSGIIGVDDCDEPAESGADRPRTFVHTFAPPPRLILVGANDFVRATSSIGRSLGYRVTVVDARPVFATRARFPDADEVVVDWPHRYLESEIRSGTVDATSAICVMTHDPKFDVPTLRVALAYSAAGFVGALGSRRTVADRNDRLVESGVTAAQLSRLRSPLGLDLGGHTPAEVAVSIAAQLIADRHAASAAPLHTTSGPLHR